MYIRLIKWALQAFDIYTMTVPGMVQNVRLTNQARARSKEEIEVLEHFNGIVSLKIYISLIVRCSRLSKILVKPFFFLKREVQFIFSDFDVMVSYVFE